MYYVLIEVREGALFNDVFLTFFVNFSAMAYNDIYNVY